MAFSGSKNTVIAITGYQFSGKTTVGMMIAKQHGYHYMDDDIFRHALFPKNDSLDLPSRKRVYAYIREAMMGAAEINLDLGRSMVITSTFGTMEAKQPFLSLRSRWLEKTSFHIFRLVLSEESRMTLVRQRAIQRYGTNEEVLQRKIAGYKK
ncbi:MAG: AAA family ATPase [Patescibacteria group bacterium]